MWDRLVSETTESDDAEISTTLGLLGNPKDFHLDQTKLLPAPNLPWDTDLLYNPLEMCPSPYHTPGNGELTTSNLLEIAIPPRSLR